MFYHLSIPIAVYNFEGASSLSPGIARYEDWKIRKEYNLVCRNKNNIALIIYVRFFLTLLLPSIVKSYRRGRFYMAAQKWNNKIEDCIPEWYREKYSFLEKE